jgi:hypothetical protein
MFQGHIRHGGEMMTRTVAVWWLDWPTKYTMLPLGFGEGIVRVTWAVEPSVLAVAVTSKVPVRLSQLTVTDSPLAKPYPVNMNFR